MDGAASGARRSTQVQVLVGNGNTANQGGSRSNDSRQSVAGLVPHRSFPTSQRRRTEPATREVQRELEGVTSSVTKHSCPNQKKTL